MIVGAVDVALFLLERFPTSHPLACCQDNVQGGCVANGRRGIQFIGRVLDGDSRVHAEPRTGSLSFFPHDSQMPIPFVWSCR